MRKELEKETAQEAIVQKQFYNRYPMKIQFKSAITGVNEYDNIVYSSLEAITVTVEIDSNLYSKKDIELELNSICQKVLEYFR